MNKYLIVEFKTTRNGTFLKHAYFFHNGKKHVIKNLNKVTAIINKYNGDIYEKLYDNVYKISNTRVLNEFQRYKIERRNKYIGIVLSGSILFGGYSAIADAATDLIKNNENNNNIISTIFEKSKTDESIDEDSKVSQSTIKEDDAAYETTNSYSYDDSTNQYSNIDETSTLNTTSTISNDNNVISFSYTDRTNTNTYNHTRENYSNAAYENSIKYGVDYELIMAMICQENPYNKVNNSGVGANGVMQIENVWYNQNVRATYYNDERGSLEYETVKVNKDNLVNPEYSIKIGCMILNNYFENIYKNYVILNDILTESEALEASIRAYNKGITAISNLINEYGSDYDKHLSETNGGDNKYLEHVASYLKDGYKIQFRTPDGHICSSYIDNTTVDTFKR